MMQAVPLPCWCGESASRVIGRFDQRGHPLTTVACRHCGTIRQDPRMPQTVADQYYRDHYEQDGRDPATFFAEQVAKNRGPLFEAVFPHSFKILDYGCGPGGILHSLVQHGFEVFGFDVNENYISHAVANGLRPFVPGMTVDVLYLSHTIEHWTDLLDSLRKIVRGSLRRGGFVVIEVPLIDRLLLGDRKTGLEGDVKFHHLWYFSVRSLDKVMAQLGCRRVYTDRLEVCIYREDAECTSDIRSTPLRDRLLPASIQICSRTPLARVVAAVGRRSAFFDFEHCRLKPLAAAGIAPTGRNSVGEEPS